MTTQKLKAIWQQLVNKYNGVYLDLEKIDNAKKRGLGIIP